MLKLPTGRTEDCERFHRREFLEIGTLTAFGLSLPGVLRLEAALPPERRREISCILLWMGGGPSHLDTFDPKPDAPAEIRGEFGTIPTPHPGVRIVEHLPRLARLARKYSILRSLTSPDTSHERATHYLLTGYRFNPAIEYPAMGSVVARELGFRRGLPPYVHLGGLPFGYGGAGYMGSRYNPFVVDADPARSNFTVRDLTPPGGVGIGRIERRRRFLESVDTFRRKLDLEPVRAIDAFYAKAYDLVTSPAAARAFRLEEEHPRVRERYGRHRFGQSCLLARRLVEAGVRFVTVNSGGWDTHQNNFKALRDARLPELDQGFSALLEDLEASGRLADTLVLWMGEFGRTPKVNPSAGRDHWSRAMCAVLAGGGVEPGLVIGATNERAEEPTERPIRVEDLVATVYALFGIDSQKEYISPQNRPIKINYDGLPVAELLG